MTTYDASFFDALRSSSRSSAAVLVPHLVDLYSPASAIDVGCGTAEWLGELQRCGVEDVIGVNGDPQTDIAIAQERFLVRDLDRPLALDRTFDLALSLEVAEHLSPSRSEAFIDELTALAPVVVFSAAVPFQPGEGHINAHPQSWWVERFRARGYRATDPIRPAFWDDDRVAWWYRQNILVYVRDDGSTEHPVPPPTMPFDVVHPELLVIHGTPKSIGDIARRLPGAVRDSVRHRLS